MNLITIEKITVFLIAVSIVIQIEQNKHLHAIGEDAKRIADNLEGLKQIDFNKLKKFLG